jgi:8-oxo-dGTP pyrophosphatase MutT (NUDIX family)
MFWGMKIAVRLFAPRQCVGAVGVVFNQEGKILILEHVFRTDFPWGLPGGWIERGENPVETVRREIEEELKLKVEVRELLFSEQVGLVPKSTHPPHLGLAYYCKFISGVMANAPEILSVEWADPHNIKQEIAPFQRKAIMAGREIFCRENSTSKNDFEIKVENCEP